MMMEKVQFIFADGPFRTVAIAATAVAVGAIAWKCLRQGRAARDAEALNALILQESEERERRVVLGPLSAVHVMPRSRTGTPLDAGELGSSENVSVFFIHGMWHGCWYFRALQSMFAEKGIGSYAVTLNAGLTVGLDQHVKDVAAALKSLPQNTRLVLVGHSQGGIILQDLLHTVSDTQLPQICAAALLGTGALGQQKLVDPTASSVRNSVVSSAGWLRPAYGSYYEPTSGDVAALQAMFARFETSEVSVTGKNIPIEDYLRLLRGRPADGWPTYVSNVAKWGNRKVPSKLGGVKRPCSAI